MGLGLRWVEVVCALPHAVTQSPLIASRTMRTPVFSDERTGREGSLRWCHSASALAWRLLSCEPMVGVLRNGVVAVVVCAGAGGLTVAGCGSAQAHGGALARVADAKPRTVRVSGHVARSCVGPLVYGRPPRCLDIAVFQRNGRRTSVHGAFRIRLRPGTYRVSVDSCMDQQKLRVTNSLTGLKLAPRCALPM